MITYVSEYFSSGPKFITCSPDIPKSKLKYIRDTATMKKHFVAKMSFNLEISIFCYWSLILAASLAGRCILLNN